MIERPLPGDHLERRKAIESRKNVAVTAGAGTGKTTLLVEKILHKVTEEGVDLKRILALTFTEKAANEMRQRLRIKLRAGGPLEDLPKAEIGTIHSFCAHILRQFPVEAGVAPDFEVDEGTIFRRRFEEAWPRWLDRELGHDARRPRQWKELLTKVELRTLRELAEGLASFGVPPDDRDGGVKLLSGYVKDLTPKFPKIAAALAGKDKAKSAPSKAGAQEKHAHKLAADIVEIDEPLIERAVGLLDDFALEFKRDFVRAGWVSFDGILSIVLDLFRSKDFSNVLDLLRDRYQCILVDEFQDTDPVQGEIVQLLAQGPDKKLVPGKLFLVGDPKQSIYSFRGADIIAYEQLADRIIAEGGDRVILRTNFRSHAKILDLVNAAFSRVIQKHDQLQPQYERIDPAVDAVQKHADPTIEAILIEDAKAGQSRELEAEEIARWIAARRAGIEFKDIAILFRSLGDVPLYIDALRAKEIPYIVEGEKYFYGTSEVIDFVNLLRAVANPHDRIAVAGVLRSPFGGAADPEIYERRKALDYRTSGDFPVFGFLRRWNAQAGRAGVSALIDTIFTESYALEIAQAGSHGEQAVANLLKLRQKAAELEEKGSCTLREFLDVIRLAVQELEEEGESPLADESLDAVRILSIHRSKGLEFPVVILPDLHRAPVSHKTQTVRYDRSSKTLGVKLGDAMNAGAAALAFLDRERKREENRRLLYVAMTRAEEILVLLGSDAAGDETFLGLLRPDLDGRAAVTMKKYRRPPFHPAPAEPERKVPDWGAFVERWREREKRAAVVERFTSPSKLEKEEQIDRVLYTSETSETPSSPSRATEVGTICHAVLEHLDFKVPAVPEATDPEAAEILKKFFKSAPFKELAGAEILARELPFVLPRGNQIVQGVIDVVYRSGGKVYVADYKTDKLMEPGDYGLIREIYTEAVRQALKIEPGFKLIYLRQGRAVET
jgi:ATP-dependent helicase/nuclease subunit A